MSQKVAMPDVGDIHRFGFRIGPPTSEAEIRDVAIFINGENVTAVDSSAYLPSYVEGLRRQSDVLKQRLNFEKYSDVFRQCTLAETHNSLLHGDRSLFENDGERCDVADFHRFMEMGEPNTDLFVAFLLPADVGLSLTYQCREAAGDFARKDAVKGIDKVLPHELIKTIDEAINLLTSEGNSSVN
jgi:hypothetical protein